MAPYIEFINHQTADSSRLTLAELIQKQIDISPAMNGAQNAL